MAIPIGARTGIMIIPAATISITMPMNNMNTMMSSIMIPAFWVIAIRKSAAMRGKFWVTRIHANMPAADRTIITMPDNRIVLVRRAIEPGYGLWVFPGGYVDRGEVVSAAAIREAREEAGLDVRLDGLISIYSYARRPPVVIVYAATATGGTLAHDDESLEIGTFSNADIPWDELAFLSPHEALNDYYAGKLHPHCR